jgi:tRNA (cytidine/uridine-2'-O-)-methyltransferase
MKIVLLCPEIPQNTGNIIRLCACTGITLILVGPLGFSLTNKLLKRSGLDYHDMASVIYIEDKISFFNEYSNSIYEYNFISKNGNKLYTEINLDGEKETLLIFGNETQGLPPCFYMHYINKLYRIPMVNEARCLNLANSVSIVLYSLLSKQKFYGLC